VKSRIYGSSSLRPSPQARYAGLFEQVRVRGGRRVVVIVLALTGAVITLISSLSAIAG
jgi:hypothetical protein